MGDEIIDPEWERYAKKYPSFPGVQKCVELLGSSFLRGTRVDFVVNMMENHAHDHVDELIDAYWAQSDERLRAIIANVISNEPIENTEDFFWNVLNSQHKESWWSAFYGLKQLNSKNARTYLWQARSLHPENAYYQSELQSL